LENEEERLVTSSNHAIQLATSLSQQLAMPSNDPSLILRAEVSKLQRYASFEHVKDIMIRRQCLRLLGDINEIYVEHKNRKGNYLKWVSRPKYFKEWNKRMEHLQGLKDNLQVHYRWLHMIRT
jgi:hypothetical protein